MNTTEKTTVRKEIGVKKYPYTLEDAEKKCVIIRKFEDEKADELVKLFKGCSFEEVEKILVCVRSKIYSFGRIN